MAWYKNKQRDVRPATPEDEGYDPALSQVFIKMDDGTEELVDATLLGTGDLPPTPPAAQTSHARKPANERT